MSFKLFLFVASLTFLVFPAVAMPASAHACLETQTSIPCGGCPDNADLVHVHYHVSFPQGSYLICVSAGAIAPPPAADPVFAVDSFFHWLNNALAPQL